MSSHTADQRAPALNKALFEAGLQCSKRLYLDVHAPVDAVVSTARRMLAGSGQQLVELARSAFPKGEEIKETAHAAAVARTRTLLAADTTTVLFGAAFAHDGVEVRTDIVLRQKDGAVDVFEVKSGIKANPRYLLDLALQVHVIEHSGTRVRAINLLHLNPRYVHKEGEAYAAQQLLKSSDVTDRVRRQLTRLGQQLAAFRTVIADEGVLQLPTGLWCTEPFRCPHLASCSKKEPEFPLRELPELTRVQEAKLHEEGIEDLKAVDSKRPGLTFRQRRTVQCVQQGAPIVEAFVAEELRALPLPVHFMAIAAEVAVLPRFGGQRPWRQVPRAFAVTTLLPDGRAETTTFAHADKDDPRPLFVKALAERLGTAGTMLCWCDEQFLGLRGLLDQQLEEKPLLRAILARPHFDLKKLLESGWFHPELHNRHDLRSCSRLLLGTDPAEALAVQDDDQMLAAIEKIQAPRLRAATREKAAADLTAYVAWQTETMLAIHRHFAAPAVQPKPPAAAAAPAAPRKQLPGKPPA